ncbi:glycosyltransferase [Sediminicoccus rosea]|jgi:cellulose synthase (UDP-forming)|uniref:Glycosyltransferase n=1 Tax=Sediminicoccus rosea TaxID=1225128 RepID=A0ABZ0PH12_9PROT|nr:glycosyltransferase [Sediminicoccus rosea]WPB84920.1 glycosyltransferase [Sediminicoccus rosea]
MPDATWVPALLALGLPLLVVTLCGPRAALSRAVCLGLALFFTARYLAWRWGAPLPEGGAFQAAWAWAFLVMETLAALSSALVMVFLLRHRDRTADAAHPAPPALRDAPVDVLLCTYNEGPEILERSILCATRIAHADLRVWVLDDGARDWVRDLAAELGALYVRRVKGRHAKAGNVNNGLAHAISTGRRPEFVLLLDADFSAHRDILRRTLPLFRAADVGIVQTPQHFFNPDPLQAGLLCAKALPDEQRFFFNHILPAKDAWGAAFCCGTSAVLRVEALLQAGGMAVETVTEDMLTSFKLAEHGWRTIFLDEALSAGLAPEGLGEYVGQRARWCLGAMQQIHTRWSFAGAGRMPLAQRISCLDTVLYWGTSFLARLMMLVAPILFWWFGISSFAASPGELAFWMAPHLLAGMLGLALLSRGRLLPVLSEVSQLVITFPVLATVARTLVRPFGQPFRVTPKGLSSTRITIHWGLLAPFALMALLTAGGMLTALDPWSPARVQEGYALNMLWSLLNLLLLCTVIATCVELPRPRQEERFATDEPAQILLADGTRLPTRLRDLSTRGALVDTAGRVARQGELLLDRGALRIPFRLVRVTEGGLALRFVIGTALRRVLILRLYTGAYRNEVAEPKLGLVMRGMLRRLIG